MDLRKAIRKSFSDLMNIGSLRAQDIIFLKKSLRLGESYTWTLSDLVILNDAARRATLIKYLQLIMV